MSFHYSRLIIILLIAILFGPATSKVKKSDRIKKEIANDQIHELTDANFQYYLSQKEYKWFILFYLKTCAHCARAMKEITNIYQTVLDSSMRFGQLEIQINVMTAIRFNSTQAPYIVLFQDDKMYEFTKYPNEKNLKEFINADKTDEDSLPIPPPVKLIYFAWVMLRDGVKSLCMFIEKYLKTKGYDIKIKSSYVAIFAVFILALFFLFEFWFISRCCPIDDFDKYIQQQELEIKLKENKENREGNADDGDNNNIENKAEDDQLQHQQGEDVKDTIDEETKRKEAELNKEKEAKKEKAKQNKENQDDDNKKDIKTE